MNNIIGKLFIGLALYGVMTSNLVYSDLGNDWCILTNNDERNYVIKREILNEWQDLTKESKKIKDNCIRNLYKDGWIDTVEQEKINTIKDKLSNTYSQISDNLNGNKNDIDTLESDISNLLDGSEKMPLLLDNDNLNYLHDNFQVVHDKLNDFIDNFDTNIFNNSINAPEVINDINSNVNTFSNIVNSQYLNNIKSFIKEQEDKIKVIKHYYDIDQLDRQIADLNSLSKKVNFARKRDISDKIKTLNQTKLAKQNEMAGLVMKYNECNNLILFLKRKSYNELCNNIAENYNGKDKKSLDAAQIQVNKVLDEDSNIYSNLNIGRINDVKREVHKVTKLIRENEIIYEIDKNIQTSINDFAEELAFWKQYINNIEKTYDSLRSISNQLNNIKQENNNKKNITKKVKKNSGVFSKVLGFIGR